LGGSTGGSDDGTLFLAGQSCVVNVAQGNGGPLYLTINDEITGLGNNDGTISVEVLRSIQAGGAPGPGLGAVHGACPGPGLEPLGAHPALVATFLGALGDGGA